MAHDCYRKLQRHLNRMPVGFPRTIGGVELRLLRHLFTPREARLAACMQHQLETVNAIVQRGAAAGVESQDIPMLLRAMAAKGAILNVHRQGRDMYALVPLVVGMYEFQAVRLNETMYRDTIAYFKRGYALEYLSTAVPQTRIIPIQKSLNGGHAVATYDEIRQLVRQADGKIGLAPCICRKGKDMVGAPCRQTDQRDVCLVMRDLYDHGHRHGLVKAISAEQALALLDENQKAGLVLQPSNEQIPQFVCSCCQCCCGILGMLNALPVPSAFVASNYYASVDPQRCNGCRACAVRCQMDAVALGDKTARIDTDRCIGCGVCVPTCKQDALSLVQRAAPCHPPATTEALYDTIAAHKRGPWARIRTGLSIALSGAARKLKSSRLQSRR